ncbi:MAG: hypothetical protein V3U65_05235 [Granulosicoccaceae bacterium]
MYDLSKRNTLKLISASTAGVVLPTSLLMAEAAMRQATQFPESKPRKPDLLINLVRSTAVPDDTVLLLNTTSDRLVIGQFMPGTIVFDDVQVNLNEAAGGKELILEPNQFLSLRTQMTPVQSDGIVEYVWADSSAHPMTEDVSLVFMGAFMADDRAIVFPHQTPAAQTLFPA